MQFKNNLKNNWLSNNLFFFTLFFNGYNKKTFIIIFVHMIFAHILGKLL